MDDAVNVLGLDTEFLSLASAGTRRAVAFLEHVLGACGVLLLLSLGLFDKARDPPTFIAVAVVAVAAINSDHFPEQLTLGPALLLGESFHFLDDRRRDGEAHDFGCSAHVHELVNRLLILVKLIITSQRNSSTSLPPEQGSG